MKILEIVEREDLGSPAVFENIRSRFLDPTANQPNAAPICSWISPIKNTECNIGETLLFNGKADDPDGSISRIEFYADNQLWNVFYGNSFEFTIKTELAASVEVFFKAYDNKLGVSLSEKLLINVNKPVNNLPNCLWLGPESHYWGEVGTPVWFAGEATDIDGQITKIEIFADDQLWNTVESYAFAYQITPTEELNSTIYFKAYDNNGGVSESAKKRIVVVLPSATKPFSLSLFSNDGGVFLGTLSTNQFLTDGVFNEFGDFGSKYNQNSIWYNFGQYGSTFSRYSAFNQFSFSPPKIIDQYGNHVGYLSKNKLLATNLPIIDPGDLYDVLLRLGL